MAKANPSLLYEIQVTMNGYKQDSLRSDPELTELRVDSLFKQLADVDSLGTITKRDTVLIREVYHNDRTARRTVDRNV